MSASRFLESKIIIVQSAGILNIWFINKMHVEIGEDHRASQVSVDTVKVQDTNNTVQHFISPRHAYIKGKSMHRLVYTFR